MLKKTQILNLNKFQKLAILDRRSFGNVVKIEEKDTHQFFTAQILNNFYFDNSIILREIKIYQMNHPSISKFIGYCPFDFENNGNPVIITQFYQNRTLKQLFELKKSPQLSILFPNTKKLINIYGIASALSFLHDNHVLHGDLRPCNIYLDDHLYPQILNFGLLRNYDEDDHSNDSIVSEISYYIAPEVFNGNRYTTAADVYSFSLILYELLTNESPFQGFGILEFVTKVTQQGYRPNIMNKPIPKCYKELITSCWSKYPNDRPNINSILNLLKENVEFVSDFGIDENEYFSYISHIENRQDKLDSNLSKIYVFPLTQNHPFSITSQIINLAKFEKNERIGEGSRSIVYEITYKENNEKYASKIMKREFFKDFENNDFDSIYLKSEVEILQKLNHPSILRFVGYSPTDFENSFHPVIVTELVSNRSLEDIFELERNGLACEFWNDTKRLINIYGIASSMKYLHSLNILHRNLKPSNILIDELFYPKLSDFCFSKEISSNEEEANLLGTYTYIAPEIYSNLEYSKASDVYAFSFIVYEIVTNQKPFLGSTVFQIMTNSVNCFRPSFSNISMPNCYKKLIETCWSPDPKKRPSFDDIIVYLKAEKGFLSEFINQEEFFDYVEKIDNFQSTYNPSKTLLKVDFDSIYNKNIQNQQYRKEDGFVDLKKFAQKKLIINEDEFSTSFDIIDDNFDIYTAKESKIEIHDLFNRNTNNLINDFQSLLNLNHPLLIRFIGYSSVDFNNVKKPVFITEKQPTKTLENFIDIERNGLCVEGWNDTKKLINIFGIASCMSYLHSNNILHHNLKPKNVLIDDFDHPKISNIGYYIQNQMKKCMTIHSSFGIKDNPAYYAPEIFISGQFTKASDVYSFGYIVYEIITNEKPFKNFVDPFQIIKEVVNNLGRPEINSSVPGCYKELIESCWKQNPSERPSFNQIVDTLMNDSRFITNNVNPQEFQDFVKLISIKENQPIKEEEADHVTQASNQNDPVALFNLGLNYSKGQNGYPRNKEKAAQLYEKAASLGNINALYHLGLMYLKGDGVPKNKQKAAKLFEVASLKGDARSQFNLGVMYSKGEGVPQSYAKALELYEKAAAQDDAEAQVNLGIMYDQGEGVPINKRKAFELYTKSASKGNPIAQYNLGIMYQKGLEGILQKDNQKAIELYEKASNQGIALAQYNLGVLYLNGDEDVAINKDRAIELFEEAASQGYADAQLNLGLLYSQTNKPRMIEMFTKAAQQNHPKALFNLGLLYMKGEIVKKDPRKALEYYTKAVELNLQQAKFNLGVLYFRGDEGVPQNRKKAAELFEQVYEVNPKACFNLGIMYMTGDGVQKDERKAIQLFERAASFNNADALLNLGVIFDDGSCGVIKSKQKALYYYKRAADLGKSKAQTNLALMYQKGIGCEVDKEKAKRYFKMASDQGNDQAQLNLALLLFEGDGFERIEALKYLQSSASLGNPVAMFYLAKKYQQNDDIKSAIDYFNRASNGGYYRALFELGKIYLKGEGVEKDVEKAEECMREAAAHDVKEALLFLSDFEKNPKDSIDNSPIKDVYNSIEMKVREIHSIVLNDPYNDFISALSDVREYFTNRGLNECLNVNLRVRKMLHHFEREAAKIMSSNKRSLPSLKSASKRSPSKTSTASTSTTSTSASVASEEEISKLKIDVQSLETRLSQLNRRIELESNSPRRSNRSPTSPHQPNPIVTASPGQSSLDSQSAVSAVVGFEPNYIKKLMKKAENGDTKAQVQLGAYYSTGKRVARSYETALEYYLMAADQGNVNAQYAAGCFYYEGKGTVTDKDKAFKYFSLAADQGHIKAQFALGHFYQYDRDKNQENYEKAVEWYEKAAEQGHEAAINILRKEKDNLLK